ncbi:DUF1707 SHOCT-like domain-containing protein [Actinomadura roseirufa]|uniref:DUF1707 SHOCT-like domain-containing protein n=1 Tax=Actinomadura roseirufa TaxID=2094049 RepID=UPI0010410E2D|nr:DUF1707 domain-containing protein [Actinomadura roseirufa]
MQPRTATTPQPPSAAPTLAPSGGVRADDRDRDAAVQALADALTEGALDAAEHARRLGLALTATTRDDLARLTADLPVSRAALDRADTARRAARADADRREWYGEWGHWGGGAVIMSAIWAAGALHAGHWTFFWPVVPLAIWAAVLVAHAIRPERTGR